MQTKPVLTTLFNNTQKLCKLELPKSPIGKLRIDTTISKENPTLFVSKILNEKNEEIGAEIFDIKNSNTKDMFGYSISIPPQYRGKRLGELLRLSSIIEMIENNVEKIKIYSKNTAIYFHSKYKFKPDFQSFSHRNEALKTVCECKLKDFADIKKEAEILLQKIENTETNKTKEQKLLSTEANKILTKYINKIIETNNEKQLQFDVGFNMSLSRSSVFENKDFFNELFKRHGIDYKI